MSEYTDPYRLTESQPDDPESINQARGTQDPLDAARARLNAAYETAREKSSQALRQAEAYVRKSPIEAVGYAAGISAVIGLVAGLLIGRKD
jgi:ElaB/YqjD/DUF883 family membrane-anchored ribosome-binding protein